MLVNVDAKNLAFLVNPDDAVRCLMLGSHEDGLAGDTVHIYASARLEIIEVNDAVFFHQVNDPMLLGYSHGDWEVVRSFGWEVDIDCFLDEGG